MFVKLLKICTGESNLNSTKSYRDIPESELFVKLVNFVKTDLNCNFLANKLKRWFNDNNGQIDKDFAFRFKGKESFSYLKHFPALISMIVSNVTTESVKFRLSQIHYESICLRKIIFYAVRIEGFNEVLLEEMKIECQKLFKASCIFEQSVSPSLWTLCIAAPEHANITLAEYGFGLGCNTMEGREQKHQRIVKYAENTTFQNRWPQIFRHEFVQLIYLREQGYAGLPQNLENLEKG